MKPTISKPFKSNDRTFEKVFGLFNKKDYFNVKGLAKVQIGNFERALQKNDKNAQQLLDMFKGDDKKAKEYIIQVIHDRKKEQAFNDYKALKHAVDSIQKGKPEVGAVDYVKRIIHNNNQKYSIALYSAISGKRINNYKDIHKDIDSLVSESVNEAYVVLYSPKKGVKPVTTAAYKDKKDAEKWAKDLGGITMIVKKKVKGIDEGKKRYYQQDRVGSAKYTISYHDGKKKHKDGSDFFDIQTFRNKKDLAKFVNTLHKGGYVYGFDESVNEGSMDWEKHFKGYNEKELKVISKLIFMNPQGIDGVIKMSKKKDFKPFIQKAAKKGLGESVNEAKKRFDVDFYKGNGDRQTSHEEIIRGDKFSDIVSQATKIAKSKGMNHVEFYYKDAFIGSIDKRDKYSFKKGRHFSKSPLSVNEDKNQIIQLKKKVNKNEIKFYDALDVVEKKLGKRKYRIFLEKSLKQFGINGNHYDYRTNAAAEEKLFQVAK